MEDFLKPLDGIKKVDVPPFLLTRIQQRIQNELSNSVSVRMAYAITVSLVLLLSINGFVMLQDNKTIGAESSIAKSFQLMPDNNLYK